MDRILVLLKMLLTLLFLVQLSLANAESSSTKSVVCSQRALRAKNTSSFICSNLKTLQKYLDKARGNTTTIIIQESNIPLVPGHAFIRFSTTLETLDMHMCGIETIDAQGLVGLTKLKKLILWGNKMTWISSNWFINLGNLQLLDLSFNRIQDIEHLVYQMLPNLEYFYIDYNELRTIPFTLFSYLSRLKKVKFGMNNWNWAFRVHLTWQLIYQKVDFQDDWENWSWLSDTVRECVESGQGSIPSDQVLDCVTLKLINTARDQLTGSRNNTLSISTPCSYEASSLLHCTSKDNPGNNNATAIRVALQGFNTIFKHMAYSRGTFNIL